MHKHDCVIWFSIDVRESVWVCVGV